MYLREGSSEGRGVAIGGRGGKSPLKVSKKDKLENAGYIHASKLLKLAFLSSLTMEYMLWKGFLS